MSRCPTLMVQGTASSVGKSLLVTALCRFFRREGLRVAPFKAQNMALNSAVTPDGLEIGRAQAVQAEAAGLPPSVLMNPILLKPEGDSRAQVVVMGRPQARMDAAEYHAYKPTLKRLIAECLEELRAQYDLVLIEGAGSPAEINLKDRDIVNMHVARVAEAPVILVGDIDRGGVFAAFVGTMELLDADERERVAAFLINKFRGDVRLLDPGLEFLTRRTGKPVLGVVPYVPRLRIADEDSVALEDRAGRAPAGAGGIDIAVVRLPRISNYDDVLPLEHEPGVTVRFIERADDLGDADLVILPGSKNTVADLAWLRATGLAAAIAVRAAGAEPVLGICGGCQMLGERIDDPHGVESTAPRTAGLGLLPLRTTFERDKVTAQVEARVAAPSFLADGVGGDLVLTGYEIHMGLVERTGSEAAPFLVTRRNGAAAGIPDGAVDAHRHIAGTMLHGLFENAPLRVALLDWLRRRKGITAVGAGALPDRDREYDRLEAALRDHVDQALLWRLTGLR